MNSPEDIISDEEIERVQEHGLIDGQYQLTPKGRIYLWAAFRKERSV